MRTRPSDWSALDRDSDPVPGDADELAAEGRHYSAVALTIRDQVARLRSIAVGEGLSGGYADSLRDSSAELADGLERARGRFETVGAELTKLVDDLEVGPVRATYDRHQGTATPAPPSSQPFWIDSSQGAGTQTIRWKAGEGDWAVVVMRPDSAAGVRAEVGVAADVDGVLPVGIAMLVAGLGLIGAGVVVGGLGAARRVNRRRGTPETRT